MEEASGFFRALISPPNITESLFARMVGRRNYHKLFGTIGHIWFAYENHLPTDNFFLLLVWLDWCIAMRNIICNCTCCERSLKCRVQTTKLMTVIANTMSCIAFSTTPKSLAHTCYSSLVQATVCFLSLSQYLLLPLSLHPVHPRSCRSIQTIQLVASSPSCRYAVANVSFTRLK